MKIFYLVFVIGLILDKQTTVSGQNQADLCEVTFDRSEIAWVQEPGLFIPKSVALKVRSFEAKETFSWKTTIPSDILLEPPSLSNRNAFDLNKDYQLELRLPHAKAFKKKSRINLSIILINRKNVRLGLGLPGRISCKIKIQ